MVMQTEMRYVPVKKLYYRRSEDSTLDIVGTGIIHELAESIKLLGVVNPLLVQVPHDTDTSRTNGWFRVISGVRRLAAIKLLVMMKKMKRPDLIPVQVLKTRMSDDEITSYRLSESRPRSEPTHDGRPLAGCRQEMTTLQKRIERGTWPPGAPTVTIRELAVRSGISEAFIEKTINLQTTATSEHVGLMPFQRDYLDQLIAAGKRDGVIFKGSRNVGKTEAVRQMLAIDLENQCGPVIMDESSYLGNYQAEDRTHRKGEKYVGPFIYDVVMPSDHDVMKNLRNKQTLMEMWNATKTKDYAEYSEQKQIYEMDFAGAEIRMANYYLGETITRYFDLGSNW